MNYLPKELQLLILNNLYYKDLVATGLGDNNYFKERLGKDFKAWGKLRDKLIKELSNLSPVQIYSLWSQIYHGEESEIDEDLDLMAEYALKNLTQKEFFKTLEALIGFNFEIAGVTLWSKILSQMYQKKILNTFLNTITYNTKVFIKLLHDAIYIEDRKIAKQILNEIMIKIIEHGDSFKLFSPLGDTIGDLLGDGIWK